MEVSFVIVSYNTCDFLKGCLQSLTESIGHSFVYEVIVVDNGSVDGTLPMLALEYPWVKLLRNSENIGYTKAMNMGLKIGQGDYFVQLNPDVFVYPGTFQEIVTFLNQNVDIGICTPKVVNSDGSLQKQCRRSFARPWDVITYFLGLDRIFPNSRFFGRYLLTYLPENEIADVDSVSGSCMVIRQSLIEQIGYLDERFFAYQEDTDFCFRAKQSNWRVVYFPDGIIKHFGGMGGSLNDPYRSITAWHTSYFLYYQKHLARNYFFLVNWMMYAAMGLKLIIAYARFLLHFEKVVGTKKP
jgi:GT2 family glycosyltransferase